jgi:hypothetical protein
MFCFLLHHSSLSSSLSLAPPSSSPL